MTEEDVTKGIMKWLTERGWSIICYDFPHSGTGRQLHPNGSTDKTAGIVIPDIVAYRDGIVLDFENKRTFTQSDFGKVRFLRSTNNYSKAWANLLQGFPHHVIYYGIGLPYAPRNIQKSKNLLDMTDFVAFIKEDGTMNVIGEKSEIVLLLQQSNSKC